MNTAAAVVPRGWRCETLDRLCVDGAPIIYGILQPGPDQPDGVPYVRPTEIDGDVIDVSALRRTTPAIAERYRRAMLRAEDVVLSIVGTIGKVALVPPELSGANITQSSVRIRVRDDVVAPRFIAWALRSPTLTRQFDASRLGTAVPRLNVAHVRALQMPVPPLDEQRRIVAEIEKQFTRLDAGVAALRRVQSNLKRYRASVLKSACEGRLVPTEAALARAESRPFESGADLLQRILTERRAKWSGRGKYKEPVGRDTEALVELPEGWCWSTVDAVGDVLLGRRRAPEYTGAPRPYLRVANVRDGAIDMSDVLSMPFEDGEYEKYRLKAGDILASEGQSAELVGQSAICGVDQAGLCFQATLHRFRPWSYGPSAQFCQIVFQSYVRTGVFKQRATITTNIAHLSLERFKATPFPLPPLAEQHRIVEEVERRLSVIDALEAVCTTNLQRATRMRQSILQRAFSGELLEHAP